MRGRIVALLLGTGWLVPWMVALHAVNAWWIPLAAGVGMFAAGRRRPPTAVVWTLGAALAGMGAAVGGWVGLAGGALGGVAGWAARDPHPTTGLTTRLLLDLLGLTPLAVWQPQWQPAVLGAALLGVVGLAEGERPRDVRGTVWWSLVATFLIAAIGVALMVYGVAPRPVGPARADYSTLHHIHYHSLIPPWDRSQSEGLGGGPIGHGKPPPTAVPISVGPSGVRIGRAGPRLSLLAVLAIPLGVGLLGLGLWWRRRVLRGWVLRPPERSDGLAAERYPLVPPSGAPPEWLSPTRAWMRRRLQAARGRDRLASGETVREWARRVYGEVAAEAARLYEEVRYGTQDDSVIRVRQLAHLWPRPRRR